MPDRFGICPHFQSVKKNAARHRRDRGLRVSGRLEFGGLAPVIGLSANPRTISIQIAQRVIRGRGRITVKSLSIRDKERLKSCHPLGIKRGALRISARNRALATVPSVRIGVPGRERLAQKGETGDASRTAGRSSGTALGHFFVRFSRLGRIA